MVLKRSQQILGKVAATLGILQGLAGAALTLTLIILHYWPPTLTEFNTFWKSVEIAIYALFVSSKDIKYQDAIIGPKNFVIFMWLYFFLSVFWFVISVSQYIEIQYEKNQAMHMGVWGMLTLIICLLDVIFVGLLTDNYWKCSKSSDGICMVAVGIVITLAARGWTLWLVNLIFSYILIVLAKDVTKGIHWSAQTIKIPRARIQRSNSTTAQTKPTPFSVFSDTSPRSPKFLREMQRSSTLVLPDSANRPTSFSNQGSQFTY